MKNKYDFFDEFGPIFIGYVLIIGSFLLVFGPNYKAMPKYDEQGNVVIAKEPPCLINEYLPSRYGGSRACK